MGQVEKFVELFYMCVLCVLWDSIILLIDVETEAPESHN